MKSPTSWPGAFVVAAAQHDRRWLSQLALQGTMPASGWCAPSFRASTPCVAPSWASNAAGSVG
jgi:hypothetical protein